MNALDRLGYVARQGSRVAWYMGHYFASQRFRQPKPEAEAAAAKPRRRGPGLERILVEIGALFARDLVNAERGVYPVPRDHEGRLSDMLAASRRYFADLPVAAERKEQGRGDDLPMDEQSQALPSYFLQNFHYQTGGYLTEESARLYDMQVEVLFSGTANAMRRQCLVPIAEFLKGKDQRQLSLLDAACGTGRFLRSAKEAFPRLAAKGCDLSPAYIEEARRHVKPYKVELKTGAAESLPFASESFDLVTSIYLFHEVPPDIRRAIAREFARVLRPGGRFVFMDSLQTGDRPEFDGMLASFPHNFHEPYYASYIAEDLSTLFAEAGLNFVKAEPVFLSKLVVCGKG